MLFFSKQRYKNKLEVNIRYKTYARNTSQESHSLGLQLVYNLKDNSYSSNFI